MRVRGDGDRDGEPFSNGELLVAIPSSKHSFSYFNGGEKDRREPEKPLFWAPDFAQFLWVSPSYFYGEANRKPLVW